MLTIERRIKPKKIESQAAPWAPKVRPAVRLFGMLHHWLGESYVRTDKYPPPPELLPSVDTSPLPPPPTLLVMSIHRPATIPTYTGKIIDYGRLYLTSILGRGSFGIVYKAIDLQDSAQTAYAVKWVGHPGDQQDACGADYLNSEADNHSMVCDHPNIVTLHRVIDDRRRNCRWLVMAYIPGGPLIDAITTRHAFWRNETRARSVCLQLVSAVQHCHARGVYHRDIKPENVLLSDDANTVYLADFGLSTRADRSTSSSGTAAYMAPG
jgi:hypothetical protein